ncbi:hypothetical protein AQUCO_00400709v1 [Aquilegia coerulea]|uniref:Uncharacterized protein n=1 Tax=Aquilegia coerulea TaxID=218851 RepID=A0A2G5EWA2_AQUCA|nr:hypothetical protein AQUCO_00400709v1 [Aquilegia coerulea]
MAEDIVQIVLSPRFEPRTSADPFEEVYRALRIVNPSPHMTYLQNKIVNQQLEGLKLKLKMRCRKTGC